jgi:hypothetical protein
LNHAQAKICELKKEFISLLISLKTSKDYKRWMWDGKLKKYNHKELYEKRRFYSLLYSIKQRCENKKCLGFYWYGRRGIKNELSMGDIHYLWKRDKACKLKKPSIDRIDNDGNYTIANCQFIELSENVSKAQKGIKKNKRI